MKGIFLDIDGVMNSRQYIRKMDVLWDDPKFQMDPEAVARLNTITDKTGAGIIITSTWRKAFYYLHQCQDSMAEYGITGTILGMTPDLVVMGNHRGEEIKLWLDSNPLDTFIILDDEGVTDMDSYLIRTTFDLGLQDEHVQQAIARLGARDVPIESR